MLYDDSRVNEVLREVYNGTDVRRRPIAGFVSGYHQLPYILIAPDSDNSSHAIQVSGRINVSPRFVVTPNQLAEAFGEVFDPSTFADNLHARMFSFAVQKRRNVKIESLDFEVSNVEQTAADLLARTEDTLAGREDTRTGLISSPRFDYYPVSLDRFLSEIVDREFRV